MPVRIGQVGLGRFGVGFHLRRLLELDEVEVALCDRDTARFADARQRLDDARLEEAWTCADTDEFIDPERLDGIIVSTPNPDHHGPCRLALERGLPVMVDKPTTLTAAESADLHVLSRERDVPFLTAFTRRFFPAARYLRQRVRDGDVGELHVIDALQLGCPPNDRPQDGGFLHQRCVHLFDLGPWIAGSAITQVQAEVRYDGTWEDVADMRLQLASGTLMRFLSLADTGQNQDEISLYGTKENYRLQRETLFAQDRRGPWHDATDESWDGQSATTHFVDIVAGRVSPGQEVVDRHGADGLRAMQILEAVKDSGRSGQPVELPAP